MIHSATLIQSLGQWRHCSNRPGKKHAFNTERSGYCRATWMAVLCPANDYMSADFIAGTHDGTADYAVNSHFDNIKISPAKHCAC
jgi:hypothetical protein